MKKQYFQDIDNCYVEVTSHLQLVKPIPSSIAFIRSILMSALLSLLGGISRLEIVVLLFILLKPQFVVH